MDSKYFPPFLMLLAGSIVCILSVINEFSLLKMLVALLIAMFIFYELGRVVNKIVAIAKAEQEERLQLEYAQEALEQEQESGEDSETEADTDLEENENV